MAIDAMVAVVEVNPDGSGTLHLCNADDSRCRGQERLHFTSAPKEVTHLNGLHVWGGSNQILVGVRKIADRIGYTRISFIGRDAFVEALAVYQAAKVRK